MSEIFKNFTNLYPVSKTLRFELIPQGKTLENMKLNNVLQDDEYRAEIYKKAKKMIDRFHKKFIDSCLANYTITPDLLSTYCELLNDNNRDKKELDKIKESMRKEISNCFTKNPEYNKLFGKEMITKILPVFYREEKEELEILDSFSRFTTYFKGFNENRKNMYTSEEKSTAIAYRLINENLPIFVSNMKSFVYLKKVFSQDCLQEIYKNLGEIIQVNDLEEMFEIEYFNDVLTQRGIDVYNQIIGGYSKSDGSKIKGINEYINEYRQKNPQDKSISKLNMLYKQILSESETASFVIDKIENDQSLLNMLNDLYENIKNNVIEIDNNLETLLNNINNYDLSKIYIRNDLAITNISQYLYDDWSVISQSLKDEYDRTFGAPKNEKQEDNKDKYLKSKKYISIEFINECLRNNERESNIEQYFYECSEKSNKGDKINIFEKLKEKSELIKNLIKNDYSEEKHLKDDTESIALIKDYLDSLKSIQSFIKPLVGVRFENDYEKDNLFYELLSKFWDNMQEITSVYNKARNYLTGKPYSTDKIKLNFKNPTLLDGWALGNEITNSSLLFRKDGLYYIGIINNNYTSAFKNYELPENDNDIIEKMEYVQAADPQKDVQNLMVIDGKTVKKNGRRDADGINRQLEELKDKYLPDDINTIRKNKSYSKTSDNFSKDDLIKFIDYYKLRVCEYYDKFTFEFKKSEEYRDFGEFTDHINEQAYQISFKDISYKYINQLVEEGKLYFFKIYNKDFSGYSHGKPNLHTLYWKMLFDEDNLKHVVYKLNGEAEIFYRKASIKKNITHPKGQKINNKNENNPNKQSEFEYDLIKDKRFTEDKFQFHVPITMNFKGIGISNINEEVNKALKENDNNYIIGIDRGERHLLYLVLIDSNGDIVEQYTLNNIENKNNEIVYKTDYHKLLDNKEKEREKARESWQSIENIKNLKEGYLSQVINKITDLMIKYNAIVVLEDLNFGFMRGRQKVEKQVYQKFEKMLIDKLNYLVKKDKDKNECGGLLKAYQLTNQFVSFKKLGKQSGFLYYIPAWNTSKMDPVTGFVNLFYVKYENENKAKEFIKKIDDIKFNKDKDYFEFYIDYDKFTTKAEGTRTKWTLCSYGSRIKTFRNKEKNSQWDSVEIDLTMEFKKLLEENNIDILSNNLKNEILNLQGKKFWESFINLFKLMVQMRNSVSGEEKDYIISPVADEDGNFFDSRLNNAKLPNNADANGAYNIARKGLWIIDQIKNTPDDQIKNIKLAISNKEWLQYIQNKEYEK